MMKTKADCLRTVGKHFNKNTYTHTSKNCFQYFTIRRFDQKIEMLIDVD